MLSKMSTPGDIMSFVDRYQSLRAHQDTADGLIKDLILYCDGIEKNLREEKARLLQEVELYKLDLAAAQKSRREFQQQLRKAECSSGYQAALVKEQNPYVLVLIDGDGLIVRVAQFHEEYIRQGIDGGKKAAYELRKAIAEKCGKLAGEIEIVAKVCANLSGLSKAMRRDGSIDAENDLKDFTLGFTQAKASFDFIDVGHGKERADSKIKETARWNLKNSNCKHILMGISHDAGYAPFLDEIMQDEETRSCITVIEGVPTVRELRNTNVNIIHLDHLFRNDKLIDRAMSAVVSTPADSTFSRKSSIALTSTTTSASSPSNQGASPPSTWAVITGKASPPPQVTLPLAHKNINNNVARAPSQVILAKPPSPSWDPGARGLDPVISCNQAVLENIKKRKDSAKLCNNHYLRGPCSKGSECCFEHKYKPNTEEVKAIAFLARQNPCTKGQDCDVDNCIYGHHCPSTSSGVCTHPYCKFRVEDHPPGTKFKNVHIKDN